MCVWNAQGTGNKKREAQTKRIREKMFAILMNYDNTCHRKEIFAEKFSEVLALWRRSGNNSSCCSRTTHELRKCKRREYSCIVFVLAIWHERNQKIKFISQFIKHIMWKHSTQHSYTHTQPASQLGPCERVVRNAEARIRETGML